MSAGRVLVFILVLFSSLCGNAQEAKDGTNSIRKISEKKDSARVNQLVAICDTFYRTQPDEDIKLATEALVTARAIKFTKGEAYALKYIGMGYFVQGDYVKAASFFHQSLESFESINYKPGIANMMNSLGVIYNNEGADSKALELYLKSLKLSQEINDSVRVVTAMINIGLIYSKKPNTLEKAEDYYLKALANSERLHYQDAIGTVTVDLGELYFEKGDYKSALSYFERSLNAYKNSSSGNVPYTLTNIGKIYAKWGEYDKALDYQQRALKLATATNAKLEMNLALLGLAGTYQQKGDTRKALNNFMLSEQISKGIGSLYELRTAYEGISKAYSDLKDYQNAFKYQQKVSILKDTIFSEVNQLQINQLQIQYQIDNMLKENEILKRDASIQEVKNQKQKTVIFFLFLGVLSISVFTGLLVRANNHKKKVNAELAQKNDLITAQKQEITSSIQYASNIQNALLTPEEQIVKLLPDHFILFRPRDIVSGDFYWLSDSHDRIICIAADCTGHGVPGAFMSMLGIAFLNEIVSKNPEISASEVLNEMRRQVEISLRQGGREGESRDGMDVALLIFDKDMKHVEFAGAYNPLILIRNKELLEYKPDKMPIGYRDEAHKSFTSHTIEVENGDMLYLFSDGYRDQLGGPEGKRFMIKNFRNLLLEVHDKGLDAQKQILEQRLDEWIYNTQQIDDILVMGIRI